MDPTSLAPFVAGLRRVFDVAFQMNVETNALALAGTAATAPRDISAQVTLTGDVSAMVILEFSRPTAQRLVSLFSGLDVHQQDEACIRDAVGEIASMVAGNAKAHFGSMSIDSSAPIVSIEEAALAPLQDPGVSVSCLSDCGEFVLRIVPGLERTTVTTRSLREAISR